MKIDRVTPRLFISLCVGILLGSWICMVLPTYLSIVGFFSGVVLSVTIFAWKDICEIAPEAYQDLARRINSGKAYFQVTDPLKRWSRISVGTVFAQYLTFNILFFASYILWYRSNNFREFASTVLGSVVYLLLVCPACSGAYLIAAWANEYNSESKDPERRNNLIRICRKGLWIASPIGPILFAATTLRLIWNVFVKVIVAVPTILSHLVMGTVKVAEYIYSYATALCAVYAFAGIAFTYIHLYLYRGFDMTLALGIGSTLGALFGALNYEIVTKRILKPDHIRP